MKLAFFTILFSCVALNAAHAQTTAVSGSQAVVCYDQNKQIQSAELFDLFEARQFYGRQIQQWPAGTDFLKIAREVAQRLDRGLYGQMIMQELDAKHAVVRVLNMPMAEFEVDNWEKYGARPKMIGSGARLKKTDDAKSLLVPQNCKVKQLSVYVAKAEQTYLVSDIWDRLDEVSKAAFVVRGSVYRILRSRGETDSEHTRRVIALAFSNYDFKSVLDGVPDNFTYCSSGDERTSAYALIAYENQEKKTVMQFLTFAGQHLTTKSTMTVRKQAGPLADKTQYVGGFSGLPFDQEADTEFKATFDLKVNSKKQLEFRIGERRFIREGLEKLSLLRCVPGTFYKD